jgi:Putative Actinobacterial Holin-X, holin superfamily III
MADSDPTSVPALIRGLLDDTRDLIREEIALARAEIREEITAAQSVATAFSAAALAAGIGAVLLCITIGGALAYVLGWPAWAGYGIMTLLLFGAAFGAVQYGRRQLVGVRALPKTTQTVKENLAWMQNKSAGK